ncbi:MAG TPA: radical SAM protein [Caldilineae bacterium]|nr:radical SAM protein [Caldilineae bacterium]
MILAAAQAHLEEWTQTAVLYVRPQAVNLLLGKERSFSFDISGRPFGAFWEGMTYRRGLDNRWMAKWSERRDGRRARQRRWLKPEEARSLLERAHRLAEAMRVKVLDGEARSLDGDPLMDEDRERLLPALDRILALDWEALEADRERFLKVYKPIGILPPDQYLALVLQATEGCWHNACTFCTFYRDRPFRVKSPAEFEAHIQAVLEFFGPAVVLRRTIFLGDANALVIPFPRLMELFEVMNRQLPIAPGGSETIGGAPWPSARSHRFSGVYSFIDAFNVHRKSVDQWRMLREGGLRRVYIGMESGDDGLLRFLNKPGTAADVVQAVQRLKEAGIAVSVIILLGAGGEAYFDAHVQGTVQAVNAMPLRGGDIIYFSEFVEQPGSAYIRLARATGIRPLDEDRIREQERLMRSGFRWQDPSSPPRISLYDIREFLY